MVKGPHVYTCRRGVGGGGGVQVCVGVSQVWWCQQRGRGHDGGTIAITPSVRPSVAERREGVGQDPFLCV